MPLLVLGILSLLSYRDPNLCATIKIYSEVANFLTTFEFESTDIERAIIGTIGDIDSPQDADSTVSDYTC